MPARAEALKYPKLDSRKIPAYARRPIGENYCPPPDLDSIRDARKFPAADTLSWFWGNEHILTISEPHKRAHFPGGQEGLFDYLHCAVDPAFHRLLPDEPRTLVCYVDLDEFGCVVNADSLRMYGLDAAWRVLRPHLLAMPRFSPQVNAGCLTPTRFVLPIRCNDPTPWRTCG